MAEALATAIASVELVGRSLGAADLARLSWCGRDLHHTIASPSVWDGRFIQEFGAGIKAAARFSDSFANGIVLFGATLKWREKLKESLRVERGDIGRPPRVQGRGPDCIMCSTHCALYDSGIPSAGTSVHRYAGAELWDWVTTNVVEPGSAERKRREEAGETLQDIDGWVPYGDVRVCPGGKLRAYDYPGDGTLTPVEGDEGKISHVIFGVGPAPTAHGRMALDYCKELISSVLHRSFAAMDENSLNTMAMASIGTGFGGVSVEVSANIAMREAAQWLASRHCSGGSGDRETPSRAAVTAVIYEPDDYDVFTAAKDDTVSRCLAFLQDPNALDVELPLPPRPDVEEGGKHLAGEPRGLPAHCVTS